MQPLIGSKYLAGLWKTDLVRQLGWRGSNWSERPQGYRAPSWSWASIDGTIQQSHELCDFYEDKGLVSLVEVISVSIELAGSDEMGQVKGGLLHVRGHLLQLDVVRLTNSRYGGGPDHKEAEIFYDGQKTMLHVQADDERNKFKTPCSILCLPLVIFVGDELHFNALLLEAASDQATYRRVGYLGPNITDKLKQSDIDSDPVFRAVGTVDWNRPAETRFTQHRDSLVDITII